MSLFQKGFLPLLGALVFFSCESNPFDVDVSAVELNQSQLRIDRVLAAEGGIQNAHESLFNGHELMYGTYFQDILQLGQVDQPSAPNNMNGFLKDPMMKDIQQQIDSCYPVNDILKDEFLDAFRHYKYYFPEDTIPNIAFYNSGFNYGIYPTQTFIGIGLEWYIGKDNKLLERLPPAQFPKYLKDKMSEQYMVADALRGWLLVKNSDKIKGKEMLDQLVYFGKIAYVVKACLPNEEEYLKFGYQPAQYSWCSENEFMIWKSLVKEDLLFTKDARTINSFIGNAPFTKGFSNESPGKIAFFIGCNMVEDYMRNNDEVGMDELLSIDSKKILKEYRPKD